MSASGDVDGVVSMSDIELLVSGRHHDPHQVLGAHPEHDAGGDRVVIRAWRPDATEMAMRVDGRRIPMRRVHPAGVFTGVLRGSTVPRYRLETTVPNGSVAQFDDPYGFRPTLGDVDLHLLREGRHEQLCCHLGANVLVHQGVRGTAFAVWAPAARAVRVVGDFNGWDGRIHPMRVLGSSGVWEMFVPGVEAGARYRFEVLSQAGELSRPAECSEALAHGSPTCCGCCLVPNGTTGAREAGH